MPNTGQLATRNIAQKRQGVATAHRDISYTNYSSRNKARENHSQSAARPLTRSHQLEILPAIASTVRSHFEIEAVPQRIALAPDRFYIWLLIDFERWAIPIQLSGEEARSLLPLVEGEHDRSVILKIVESAMNGGAS